MNGPDPALVAYVQRRIERTRHRDSERHTLARREAARIRSHAADAMTIHPAADRAELWRANGGREPDR